MGDNRRPGRGLASTRLLLGARWLHSLWWQSSCGGGHLTPEVQVDPESAEGKRWDDDPLGSPVCLPACLFLCHPLSFSALYTFIYKVQWEAGWAKDEERNRAELWCGNVWRIGTLMCFSSFIYIHNPAWNVDYLHSYWAGPLWNPGEPLLWFPFGDCLGRDRDGLVSSWMSFVTFSFSGEKEVTGKERRKDTLILSWMHSPGLLVTSNRMEINTKTSLCLSVCFFKLPGGFKWVGKSYNACGIFLSKYSGCFLHGCQFWHDLTAWWQRYLGCLPVWGWGNWGLQRSDDLPQSYKDKKYPCYTLYILQSHCVARIFCSI